MCIIIVKHGNKLQFHESFNLYDRKGEEEEEEEVEGAKSEDRQPACPLAWLPARRRGWRCCWEDGEKSHIRPAGRVGSRTIMERASERVEWRAVSERVRLLRLLVSTRRHGLGLLTRPRTKKKREGGREGSY